MEYAKRILAAMQKEALSIREVATSTGYSYEHIRRIVSGDGAVASEAANEQLASLLHLDRDEMWRIARAEKTMHKLLIRTGDRSPASARLAALWSQLDDQKKRHLLRIMDAFYTIQEAENSLGLNLERELRPPT